MERLFQFSEFLGGLTKTLNTIPSLVLIVIGMVFCVFSSTLGLGEFHNPGPGLIPFWGGCLLIVFSLGVIIESRFRPEIGAKAHPLKGKRWRTILSVLVLFFAYVLLLDILGFVVNTFLIFMFLFKISKGVTWRMALTASLLTTTASYLVFSYFLKIPFPKGCFGF